MKRRLYILTLALVFVAAACFMAAADDKIGNRVFDAAGLFNAGQRTTLNDKAHDLILKHQQDLVIVTTADAGGKSAMAYADDYYDYNGFGIGPNYDGLLLLIDMDNREFFITTTGSAIKLFNDVKIDNMLDNIYAFVAKGDYAGGADTFLRDVDRHLVKKTQPHYWSWEFFGVGLFAVLMILGGMVMNHKKGLMAVPSTRRYINDDLCDLTRCDDVFLHSSTRRIAINNDSDSGRGGSSTHTSSSGRSHGGGGRSF